MNIANQVFGAEKNSTLMNFSIRQFFDMLSVSEKSNGTTKGSAQELPYIMHDFDLKVCCLLSFENGTIT